MPLMVSRLRRSKAWLKCKRSPQLAFYMVNLWTASWHEVPASSLEDDDDLLAELAMCTPEKWDKVREKVLHGWVKCSDSRLYHPIVAEKALEAWKSKIAFQQRTSNARAAKLLKSQQGVALSQSLFRDSTGDVTGQSQALSGSVTDLKGEVRDRDRDIKNPLPPTRGSNGASAPAEKRPRPIRDQSLAAWRKSVVAIDQIQGNHEGLTWNDARLRIDDPTAHLATEQIGGYKLIGDRDRFTESKLEERFREAYEQLVGHARGAA